MSAVNSNPIDSKVGGISGGRVIDSSEVTALASGKVEGNRKELSRSGKEFALLCRGGTGELAIRGDPRADSTGEGGNLLGEKSGLGDRREFREIKLLKNDFVLDGLVLGYKNESKHLDLGPISVHLPWNFVIRSKLEHSQTLHPEEGRMES